MSKSLASQVKWYMRRDRVKNPSPLGLKQFMERYPEAVALGSRLAAAKDSPFDNAREAMAWFTSGVKLPKCPVCGRRLTWKRYQQGEKARLEGTYDDSYKYCNRRCQRVEEKAAIDRLAATMPCAYVEPFKPMGVVEEFLKFVEDITDGEAEREYVLEGEKYCIGSVKNKVVFDIFELGSDESYYPKRHQQHRLEHAESLGWRHITVFSDEWMNNARMIKSRVKHLLNINSGVIYARCCEVREVDVSTARRFCAKYHTQTYVRCSDRLGLFYKNRMVALLMVGPSRYSKHCDYELLRYCTISSFLISGGASKLIKAFMRTHSGKVIMTYADRRWSNGNLYRKLGFDEIGCTDPSYYYYKVGPCPRRFNRVMFQKHKLEKQLEYFDPNLTEKYNMKLNGYKHIHDCGTYSFTMVIP